MAPELISVERKALNELKQMEDRKNMVSEVENVLATFSDHQQ